MQCSACQHSKIMKKLTDLLSKVLCQGENKLLPIVITNKIKNNNGKCGTAATLSTARTVAYGRSILPYHVAVKCNLCDIRKLRTFYEGVVIELINDDYFNVKRNNDDETSKHLIENLGGDETVSSIISVMSTNGDSGSSHAEACFKTFEQEIEKNSWFPVERKPEYCKDDKKYGKGITITQGNDKWHGHYYKDISGGSNKNIKDKEKQELPKKFQIFISYYDYANEEVCKHIDAIMIYYILHCFDIEKYIPAPKVIELKEHFETLLKEIYYDDGCLYDSPIIPKCLQMKNGQKILMCPLTDKKISIDAFLIKDKKCPDSIQVCHNEAVSREKIYFDETRGYIITARRPQNLFWGIQRGNMQQQEQTIDEFQSEHVNIKKENHELKEKLALLESKLALLESKLALLEK